MLGSFLLFQVQPLVAKAILPALGGSSAVWTTCMLFFQALLLGAYGYAHWLSQRSTRTIMVVHVALLVAAVVQMPLAVHARPMSADPTLAVLLLLVRTVGLPYFALSATSPLVQTLLSRDRPGFVPYRLFALSNVGSFVALLSYPILVEPRFALVLQSHVWSTGFLVWAIIMSGVCVSVARTTRGTLTGETAVATSTAADSKATARELGTWTGLAFIPSVLLVATTTHLSSCIAPIPLVWVIPLALYLVSFIVTFDKPTYYRRVPMFALSALSASVLGIGDASIGTAGGPAMRIAILAGAMFVLCTTAHGELVRKKPSPEKLTAFYLCISLGGALGGVFTGLFAPHAFTWIAERPLGALMLPAVLLVIMVREKLVREHRGVALVLGAALVGIVASQAVSERSVARARNFYGAVRVVDEKGSDGDVRRYMTHGDIVHGAQSQNPARHTDPLGYYAAWSGIGRTLTAAHTQAGDAGIHYGIVGLGVGSSLEHLHEGDRARVYEIDELVVDMARKHFDVVPRHEHQTTMVMGDARLSLEHEAPQAFDVLGLDAFSGDAIPMHLLSLEAFQVYARHVKPSGFIAVHVSNNYLDLRPVVREAARIGHWHARVIDSRPDDHGVTRARWIILNRDAAAFATWDGNAKPLPEVPVIAAWTDDFSSLWSVLR